VNDVLASEMRGPGTNTETVAGTAVDKETRFLVSSVR